MFRGGSRGAYLLSWGGAATVAPYCGSVLLAHFGSAGLWRACAATGLLAALGYLAAVPRHRTVEAGAAGVPEQPPEREWRNRGASGSSLR